jgi:glyoxylase-like metal-dependent hydrolase (beta-lactamase superfamily II)
MNILTYQVGQMQANCYFLIDGHDALVIDPGDSGEFLLEIISRQSLNVHAILATHGHFDHIMAAGEMQLALGVPFYIQQHDMFLLERIGDTAKHFLGYEPYVLAPKDVLNMELGSVNIGPFALNIISTPGHTPGSVCIYHQGEGSVFVGDLLFHGGGIGRYDFSYSDKKQLIQSIKHLLATVPDETIMYSGHGESSIMEVEQQYLDHAGLW